MRVVFDTNVFVSAALKETSWPAIAVRWVNKHGGLLKSNATEIELMEVLRRPRIAPKMAPYFIANLERLFAAAEDVAIIQRVAECRDPKDDKFLELALNGRADVIVSGDADLLILGTFRGIPIVNAAVFGRSQVR